MRQAIETRKPSSNGQLGSCPERMQSRKFCMCALGAVRVDPSISAPSGRFTFCGR
jgi:hypothetical protein